MYAGFTLETWMDQGQSVNQSIVIIKATIRKWRGSIEIPSFRHENILPSLQQHVSKQSRLPYQHFRAVQPQRTRTQLYIKHNTKGRLVRHIIYNCNPCHSKILHYKNLLSGLRFSCGKNAFVTDKTPKKLISITRRHTEGSVQSSAPPSPTPALLINAQIYPISIL